MVPFLRVAELLTHKQQLFTWSRPHIAVKGSQVGPLLLPVAARLQHQGFLAVNHLVVADRQNEMLGAAVHIEKSKFVVVVPAVKGVLAQVSQRIIHPAHGPFVVKAQALAVGHTRKSRAFLGHHHGPRHHVMHHLIQPLKESNSFQIFAPTVDVGNPLCAREIKVQHRGDGIYPQAVHVEILQPAQRRADEKHHHFIAAIVENVGVPVVVVALAGVSVLVKGRAVVVGQGVVIGGKVPRHPVQNHPDAAPVQVIHQVFEIFGGALPPRRRVVARDLIAP